MARARLSLGLRVLGRVLDRLPERGCRVIHCQFEGLADVTNVQEAA